MSARNRLGAAIGGVLITAALAVPQVANAGLLDDVLGGVNDTVNDTVGGLLGGNGGSGNGGSSGGSGSSAPAPAPAPLSSGPTTEPPLSSDDPHGSGAIIDTDVENPLIEDLGVTVGESSGSQDDQGEYHGVVKLISVTGLGNPVEVAIDSDEGESETGPLSPVNDGILTDLCTASAVCLTVLDFDSTTNGKGSTNSFTGADLSIAGTGLLGPLADTVAVNALSSNGDISETKKCQTANGDSSAAGVGVLAGAVDVAALNSSSESTACRGQSPETDSDSEVVQLNGTGVLALLGCDEDAVDDEFGLPVLLDGVCNGDDTNGSQADSPYNVRKALGIDVAPSVLALVGLGVDLDGSDSQSHAVAPARVNPPPECPDPNNPDCDNGPECPDAGNPDCGNGPNEPEGPGKFDPNGPGGPSADSPGSLPFTGAEMGTLGLIGALVMASGLGLMAIADRRRKSVQA